MADPGHAKEQRDEILHSWKEIARFLGKGIRTVQRWEASLSLPVIRSGSCSHNVLARRSELQAWISNRFVPVEREDRRALPGCAVELRQHRMTTQKVCQRTISLRQSVSQQIEMLSVAIQTLECNVRTDSRPTELAPATQPSHDIAA